jgi:hypothetical protein
VIARIQSFALEPACRTGRRGEYVFEGVGTIRCHNDSISFPVIQEATKARRVDADKIDAAKDRVEF